ncbi:DUF192 domain-containing protein [Acidisoma silvae]|uniref:DUF192 domain-containing protein n=1 Tax=Acidisoma silvae TaxID=2802396 RepID=A0A964DX42_9PROT|nr:DUF192 domain-containing protein [Acidisoma silvae]MCB8873602.1 DUF192 domain-containing protein [Acidisoma silvae]
MRLRLRTIILVFILLLVLSAVPIVLALIAPVHAQDDDPTGPQATLAVQPLTIIDDQGKPHQFKVEMAMTPQEQATGLMFRKVVPADSGMLFVFPTVQPEPFWMKNTLVPLDMVFINADGTIRAIAENTVPYSLAPVDSGGPVKAVLELQGGLTEKEQISVGDQVVAQSFGNAKPAPAAAGSN